MRLSLFVTLLITSFLFFTSCQKEVSIDSGDPSQQQPGATGNLKARINGVQWVANRGAGAARMQGLINISGLSTDKKYLTITLTDSGVHRYILSDMTMNAAALLDSTEANPMSYTTNQGIYPTQSGGEVTISRIDTAAKTISGSFFFKVFREMDDSGKTITEGSFTNLKYTTTMPASAVTDTFRVKIDGTPWTPSSITGVYMPSMNQIAVNATNSTATKTVGLAFPSAITPGNYTLDFFGATYLGLYNPDIDPNHSKAAMAGTLTILEHNTATRRIRGTFAFKGQELLNAQNTADITEGYFSVGY